jgi:hypothetical protein
MINQHVNAICLAPIDKKVMVSAVERAWMSRVRTKQGHMKEQLIPWPGIIAAKRVDRIPTVGPNSSPKYNIDPSQKRNYLDLVRRQKVLARQLVGNFNVDWSMLTERIGERVMAKL